MAEFETPPQDEGTQRATPKTDIAQEARRLLEQNVAVVAPHGAPMTICKWCGAPGRRCNHVDNWELVDLPLIFTGKLTSYREDKERAMQSMCVNGIWVHRAIAVFGNIKVAHAFMWESYGRHLANLARWVARPDIEYADGICTICEDPVHGDGVRSRDQLRHLTCDPESLWHAENERLRAWADQRMKMSERHLRGREFTGYCQCTPCRIAKAIKGGKDAVSPSGPSTTNWRAVSLTTRARRLIGAIASRLPWI